MPWVNEEIYAMKYDDDDDGDGRDEDKMKLRDVIKDDDGALFKLTP